MIPDYLESLFQFPARTEKLADLRWQAKSLTGEVATGATAAEALRKLDEAVLADESLKKLKKSFPRIA